MTPNRGQAILQFLDDMQNYGVLSGRDFNDVTGTMKARIFPRAGEDAVVWYWDWEPGLLGFNFSTATNPTANEDWFIVDYTATAVGDCNVAFYDFDTGSELFSSDYRHFPPCPHTRF